MRNRTHNLPACSVVPQRLLSDQELYAIPPFLGQFALYLSRVINATETQLWTCYTRSWVHVSGLPVIRRGITRDIDKRLSLVTRSVWYSGKAQ
jgi:hypothetical protein